MLTKRILQVEKTFPFFKKIKFSSLGLNIINQIEVRAQEMEVSINISRYGAASVL